MSPCTHPNKGAELSPEANSCSPSPLMCAVKRGHQAAVKFLLQQGSPIDLRDLNQRTSLHVAVYSSDAETLKIIIQAGGDCLLNSRDKNDKTPLHYAATKGNLQIIKELLTAGATLNIKDEDERIPLHYAVESGDLPCVRVLLEACPDSIFSTDFSLQNCLHFAARRGHLSVLKYLLDQGAAVDSRDDERLTPLILSAFCGCPLTAGILLDRGAKIDATDKNGCTALTAAASRGRVKVVRLLLDRGADLGKTTPKGKLCLQAAISNGHQDVCMEIVKHNRWKEAFPTSNTFNFIPLKSLIETFPLVAKVVMDKCIQSSPHLSSDEDYSITYNFEFVNPSLLNNGHPFFAPKTMLDYGREELIFHPLTIELMRCKWRRIGVRFFYFSAVFYLFYLASLTLHMICVKKNDLLHEHSKGVCHTAHIEAWEIFLAAMTLIYLLCEAHQAYSQKWRYIETSNVVEVCTFSTALIAVFYDRLGLDPSHRYFFLVVSVLFGYLTLLLYLQSIFESGIHVTMLFVVLKTLGKVAIMFGILVFAFALVFQLLLSKQVNAVALNLSMNDTKLQEEIKQDPFGTFDMSIMKVVAMTIGEIEYTRFFTDQQLFSPFLSHMVFLAFCVMMPIVLMNLTIGLAVGDIESIQKNAEYKRLCLEIEIIHEFLDKVPVWVLHRLHQKESIRRPNKKAKSVFQKIKGLGGKLVSGKSSYSPEDAERNVVDQLSNFFTAKMKEQDKRISSISSEMREQRLLLEKIYEVVYRNGISRGLNDTD